MPDDTARKQPQFRAEPGPLKCIAPEEGTSFWQPMPSRGYATVKSSPWDTPHNHFATGIQVLEPGASIREHAHQRNDEILFVYRGTGIARLDGEEHKLEEGTMMVLGRHRQHEVINTGEEQMKIFWVFVPPGLENWFATIGKPRTPGEPMPEPFDRPEDVGAVQDALGFQRPDD